MALYSKIPQGSGTWRLIDKDGMPIGRIWIEAHIDRIIRDGIFSDDVQAILSQTGAARRTAVRNLLATWQTDGGHSVDFSTLTHSLNNDGGVEDGNRHLFIGGNELGYLHGVDNARDSRFQRVTRLLEEIFSAEQLGTATLRNQALDTALDRFRDDGGVS